MQTLNLCLRVCALTSMFPWHRMRHISKKRALAVHEICDFVSLSSQEQVVKGCRAGLCPLEEFLEVLAQYSVSPEEYNNLCSQMEGNQQTDS